VRILLETCTFYSHTQYDIQGSYRLYEGLSFVAYVLNLSNEEFGFHQECAQYPIQREFYHLTFSFGFRWTSGPECRSCDPHDPKFPASTLLIA
jgi:hypothetical protein